MTCFHTLLDGFGVPGEGFDDEDLVPKEEGGGWDVDDEDLELPPDVVSISPGRCYRRYYGHIYRTDFDYKPDPAPILFNKFPLKHQCKEGI